MKRKIGICLAFVFTVASVFGSHSYFKSEPAVEPSNPEQVLGIIKELKDVSSLAVKLLQSAIEYNNICLKYNAAKEERERALVVYDPVSSIIAAARNDCWERVEVTKKKWFIFTDSVSYREFETYDQDKLTKREEIEKRYEKEIAQWMRANTNSDKAEKLMDEARLSLRFRLESYHQVQNIKFGSESVDILKAAKVKAEWVDEEFSLLLPQLGIMRQQFSPPKNHKLSDIKYVNDFLNLIQQRFGIWEAYHDLLKNRIEEKKLAYQARRLVLGKSPDDLECQFLFSQTRVLTDSLSEIESRIADLTAVEIELRHRLSDLKIADLKNRLGNTTDSFHLEPKEAETVAEIKANNFLSQAKPIDWEALNADEFMMK